MYVNLVIIEKNSHLGPNWKSIFHPPLDWEYCDQIQRYYDWDRCWVLTESLYINSACKSTQSIHGDIAASLFRVWFSNQYYMHSRSKRSQDKFLVLVWYYVKTAQEATPVASHHTPCAKQSTILAPCVCSFDVGLQILESSFYRKLSCLSS